MKELIYNGKKLSDIKKDSLYKSMNPIHQKLYIDNILEILKNELSGCNLGYNECLKNTNFNLVLFYLKYPSIRQSNPTMNHTIRLP